MENQVFTRRQVERSFRKFNDIVEDLFRAPFQTWSNSFSHLITHCEEDPVMKVLTEPLRINQNVDAAKWYAHAIESNEGTRPAGPYELPYNDEDRTALLFQFFLMINRDNSDINLNHFCMRVYGVDSVQEHVRTFNEQLVRKFTREVGYRLDEIMEDARGQDSIPASAMLVFEQHHHDYSMIIHGNVQGSIVAGGGSAVTDSTASYNDAEQLAAALESLRPMIQEVAEAQRTAVETALQALINATHDTSISKEQVADATKTIAQTGATITRRLREIALKVAVDLGSSAIVLGIKAGLAALGSPPDLPLTP